MLYFLDTDICSYLIKDKPKDLLTILQTKISAGHSICISAVTYAELRFGAERSAHPKKYHTLIDALIERLHQVLPWDQEAADQFAKINGHLYKKGTPIGNNDAMIAAHAITAEAVLVTNNKKHFSRVKELTMENWVK